MNPSFQRPTQSGNPNRIPSVRTRQLNPPGRVRVNGTPIRSLFGISGRSTRSANPIPIQTGSA
ncbi:hypothetical protein Taro_017976 [Colocasia esculenta]|uniref:Uncharacterized protein n=1 Tax=Colocasia esculenta TaxID=4460 RepID=A0A843UHJ3_COLES|nr:hypothetical protein [Colocasia esculenta]